MIIDSTYITLFKLTTPPTGWTKITSVNESILRVVTGSTIGTGGSVNFSSGFVSSAGITGSTTISSATINPFSITSATMGGHTHNITVTNTPGSALPTFGSPTAPPPTIRLTPNVTTTLVTGTGPPTATPSVAHTHPLPAGPGGPFSTTVNLQILYQDLILAQRN